MSSSIRHVGLNCSDYEKSRSFYMELMKTLDMEVNKEMPGEYIAWANYEFGITPCKDGKLSHAHVGFNAPSQAHVDAFHAKALALGAKDNGKPGLRDYCPGYYAAYIFDLDGNSLEAVHLDLEAMKKEKE
ncbi:Glyoxalase/bleomycin resistance protein/dioxygenase [Gongronella butleri]|nr:Glyoxalase/bleomycin resistance protein/dioxygenase [Gongronella butleri]